ncbi:Chemokine-like protein TAFA-5 [Galemys pyrenaicus]|uniref:Chemokine-like protein TAFA-5 n=1 Tax=Galemys pyrenaicus TaxID=202257 RepID=A0A8J6AIQ2_GALPY|nr:Chemokine-like protein TAFA-5 [Galemys pyrenaicus]
MPTPCCVRTGPGAGASLEQVDGRALRGNRMGWADGWPTARSHIGAFLTGQLAAGTCEIVTLDRDSSQPRRTIARQTARCACRKGQIAGTTRARPACVDGKCHALQGTTAPDRPAELPRQLG